jgi:hypothetical protein
MNMWISNSHGRSAGGAQKLWTQKVFETDGVCMYTEHLNVRTGNDCYA